MLIDLEPTAHGLDLTEDAAVKIEAVGHTTGRRLRATVADTPIGYIPQGIDVDLHQWSPRIDEIGEPVSYRDHVFVPVRLELVRANV